MAKMVYDAAKNQWRTEDAEFVAVEMTKCHKCGMKAVVYRQEAYGDTWTCTNCGDARYYGLGD